MVEFFRFFRLGVVNLLGVTVPGFLVLFFVGFGLVFPVAALLDDVSVLPGEGPSPELLSSSAAAYRENRGMATSLALVFSYLIGYLLRLSSPDVLDRISAERVLHAMGRSTGRPGPEAAANDDWPFRGEPDNKFPYLHFREYLESRGLSELAAHVRWGPPGDGGKRTKKQVNLMKLEIALRSPQLSAEVESNEAHVRLLAGAWQAVRIGKWLVLGGFLASLAGTVLHLKDGSPGTCLTFLFTGVLLAVLGAGMLWARWRTESLFHYQRVRELTQIVGSYHLALQQRSDPS